MQISKNGIEFIKKREALRLKPYLCSAGVPTIGYGWTGLVDKKKLTLTSPEITEEKAEELLIKSLQKFNKQVNDLTFGKIKQHEHDALVSFVYNLGSFHKDMKPRIINYAKTQDIAWRLKISSSMLLYVYAGGKLLKGLQNRRKLEVELFLDALYK